MPGHSSGGRFRRACALLSFFGALLVAPEAWAAPWELDLLGAGAMGDVRDRVHPDGAWVSPSAAEIADVGEDDAGEPYVRVVSVVIHPSDPPSDPGDPPYIYLYAVQIRRPDAPGARCVDRFTIGSDDFGQFDFDEDGVESRAFAPHPDAGFHDVVPGIGPVGPVVAPTWIDADRDEVVVHFDERPVCPEDGAHGVGWVSFVSRRAPRDVGAKVRFDDGSIVPANIKAPVRPPLRPEPECAVGGVPLVVGGATLSRFTPVCGCFRDDVYRENRCRFWLPDFELIRTVPSIIPPGSEFEVTWEVVPYEAGFEGFQLKDHLPPGIASPDYGEAYTIDVKATDPGEVFKASRELYVKTQQLGLYTSNVDLASKELIADLGNSYLVNKKDDPSGGLGDPACTPEGDPQAARAGLAADDDGTAGAGCTAAGSAPTGAFLVVLLGLLAFLRRRAAR